jgi:heme exporter protein D
VTDANHIEFILTAYGAAIVVVAGLVAWVMLDYRMQSAKLAEFESRGVTRGGASETAILKADEDA